MAARKKTWVDEKTRDKIRTTKLLQRLQHFALGEDEPGIKGKKIEMNANQVRAAVSLINKKLPDLTSADISMTQDMPETKQEVYDKLVEFLGEDMAKRIAPEFNKEEATKPH